MSIYKLLFGLLIIAALITAGCTGTKTMVGNDALSSAGQSARDDYKKYSVELKDEISDIKTNYRFPENATLDQYRAWLDGLGGKVALCRQMYDNTSAASKKYLAYLNNSSDEYRNVTSDDAIFQSDIESLNESYRQYSDHLDLSIKKMAIMDEYKAKLNGTTDAYNDLTGYASNAKVDSEGSYSQFIDGLGGKAGAFEASVNEAVKAGDEYLSYCEPGSAEYKAVEDNNNALKGSVSECWNVYNKYKKDFDDKMGEKSAAQSTFNDYVDKATKVGELKSGLDAYRGTAQALEKLDRSWLDGYKQRIDAFSSACNDAISAGEACKQYLDPAGSDYKSIVDNEKNMKDSMSSYDENYRKMEATYRNLHPLEYLKR